MQRALKRLMPITRTYYETQETATTRRRRQRRKRKKGKKMIVKQIFEDYLKKKKKKIGFSSSEFTFSEFILFYIPNKL